MYIVNLQNLKEYYNAAYYVYYCVYVLVVCMWKHERDGRWHMSSTIRNIIMI